MDNINAPINKFLRQSDVLNLIGIKETQFKKIVAASRFPKPVKISERAIGWIEAEVIGWMNARIAERDAKNAA